jgi:hypothetical protein
MPVINGPYGANGPAPWPVVSPFARELFVWSAATSFGDGSSPDRPLSTAIQAMKRAANAGLSTSSSSKNDGVIIHLGPRHTESVNAANWGSSLVSKNVEFRGYGAPGAADQPKLLFTAAGATFATAIPSGTVFRGVRLELCDTTADVTIALPFDFTASGCGMVGCDIVVGTTAARLCTTGIRLSAGADDFVFEGNRLWGATAAEITNAILVNAAVSRPRINGNEMSAAIATDTDGLVNFAAAAVDVRILGNYIESKAPGSTGCVRGFAGLSGTVAYNTWDTRNNGVATAQGLLVPGAVRAFQNFSSDEDGRSGVLQPVAVAT